MGLPWLSAPQAPRVLACQTVQALDDMLQALVMDHLAPDMVVLQKLLEVSGRSSQAVPPGARLACGVPGQRESGRKWTPGSSGRHP